MDFELSKNFLEVLQKIISDGTKEFACVGYLSNNRNILLDFHGCDGCSGSCDGSCEGCGACDDRCDGCCEDALWG